MNITEPNEKDREAAEIESLRAKLQQKDAEMKVLTGKTRPSTPLLQKIIEICDAGTAQEFGDADERLRAIRGLIIGEAV